MTTSSEDVANANYVSSDEESITIDDLAYLRRSERRGYMRKQSSRDKLMWARRYCVLTDKLWILNAPGPGTCAALVLLQHATRMLYVLHLFTCRFLVVGFVCVIYALISAATDSPRTPF